MTYFEFNLLPETGKIKEAWAHGVFIGEMNVDLAKYELYQLEDFYIEMVRHNSWNLVKITRTFRATCYLDPYLHAIDISALTKNC